MRYTSIFVLFAGLCSGQDGRYERLMKDILIFDAHIDTPRLFIDEAYRLADRHSYYELDLPRIREGHLGAVLFGIYAQPQDFAPAQWLPRALEVIDALHEEVRSNAKEMEFAYTSSDIERIHKAGKFAALASLEGGHPPAVSILRDFYLLGVRSMTLAHFQNNIFADSMTDQPRHGGLSARGREQSHHEIRIGMMVDVSHISDQAARDAVETSRAPVIASHSSVKSIAAIPRNMPDECDSRRTKVRRCLHQLHAGCLNSAAHQVYMKNRAQREAEIKAAGSDWARVRRIQKRYYDYMPQVNVKELLHHLDYVARLVGPEHVGLGSDFDGISGITLWG